MAALQMAALSSRLSRGRWLLTGLFGVDFPCQGQLLRKRWKDDNCRQHALTLRTPSPGRSLPSGYLSAVLFRDAIALSEGHMGRLFGLLGVVIALAIGLYVYSRQVQSSSAAAGANNPKAAINITGVRSDLISIATAERRYFASEGKYASLDELISTNYI